MIGDTWTVGAYLRDKVRRPPAPPSTPWTVRLIDPLDGPFRLFGQLSTPARPTDDLVVVLHGLGGNADSAYCRRMAAAAHLAGAATLRLSLRGAGHCGEGFYHAGLTSDLVAALAHPALDYPRVYLYGASLGGHLALRLAVDPPVAARLGGRLRAVAALCPPLDLAASCAAIDRSVRTAVYRGLILTLVSRASPQPHPAVASGPHLPACAP